MPDLTKVSVARELGTISQRTVGGGSLYDLAEGLVRAIASNNHAAFKAAYNALVSTVNANGL